MGGAIFVWIQEKYRIVKMSGEKFCIQWNKFETDLSSAFRSIREDKDFFDITLVCEDEQIEAHKLILSACSPFFKTMLRRNQHHHPLLYLKGVSYRDMEAVLNFMYHGEVNIAQNDLNSFLQVAEDLKVKGLTQQEYHKKTAQDIRKLPNVGPEIVDDDRVPNPSILSSAETKDDDETKEILPIVKTEPDETKPNILGMYEDVSHMMTMETEEYEGHYGDREYDSATLPGQDTTVQDPNKLQCDICFKLIHKNTINRHKRNAHGNCTPVQCNLCEKIFKNDTSFKGHLRQSHNIYQTNSQEGVGNPVKVSAETIFE